MSAVTITTLYEELIGGGARVVQGSLFIPDFTDEHYEQLYFVTLEAIKPYIGEDYEFWFKRQAASYHRYKARHTTTHNFYDPHTEKPLEMLTIREQLAVLKYYLYRRYHSKYGRK